MYKKQLGFKSNSYIIQESNINISIVFAWFASKYIERIAAFVTSCACVRAVATDISITHFTTGLAFCAIIITAHFAIPQFHSTISAVYSHIITIMCYIAWTGTSGAHWGIVLSATNSFCITLLAALRTFWGWIKCLDSCCQTIQRVSQSGYSSLLFRFQLFQSGVTFIIHGI